MNATAQMTVKPFHAIIAMENPQNHPSVLIAEEFEKEDVLYKTTTQSKANRDAESLARCAVLLLGICEEIQLVDPHFDITQRKCSETFLEILAARKSAPQRLRVLEIHTKRSDAFSRATQESHYRKHVERLIPAGTTLRVHFWSEGTGGEKPHPRFLLSEFGGLQFDYGLDAGDGPGDTTIVTLMDQTLWQTVRTDYSCPSPSFSISDDCIIDIRGRS
ncbi:MAG: hypothetical protein L0Z50_37805 [Verrucomicrobiales bacterium]|nr:hypothetical protein [Verrucomicrobiales bacterium]